jgi:hypothetical protein
VELTSQLPNYKYNLKLTVVAGDDLHCYAYISCTCIRNLFSERVNLKPCSLCKASEAFSRMFQAFLLPVTKIGAKTEDSPDSSISRICS